MARLKLTLNASSILEVITAMVVIVTVLGIALMIFGNVTRSSLTIKKVKAQAILQHCIIVAEQNKNYTDSIYKIGDLEISRSFSSYGNGDQLVEIRLTARDNNMDSIVSMRKVLLK